jgi:TolB protein
LTIGTGPESHPDISRDGAMLVYTTGMTGRKMFLVDRETGRQVRVPGVRNSAMAAVSPDGSSLVYQAERRSGRYDLWIQPLQNGRPSGEPQPLSDQHGVPSHPAFSPDGRWVAYYLIENGQRNIWVIPVTRGAPMRITDDSHQNQQPAWSPGGDDLAFVSERDGRSRLQVVAIDEGRPAGEPVTITKGDIDAFHPAWLPDGKAIAFVGRRGTEQEIWLVRADGSKPPYRLSSGGTIMLVRWDPAEGRLLASGLWGERTMAVRSVSLETGATVPLSPAVDFGSGSSPGMFDISADGRWIVYPYEEDRGDVWVLEASKGSY